jgi:PST family polysaccharide transporter
MREDPHRCEVTGFGGAPGSGAAVNAVAAKVATSSVILLTEAVVRLVAVAAISFWIARQLGPAQFGILNFASALTAILVGLVDMGMEVPVILRMQGPAPQGPLVGTVLGIRAAAGGLVFLLAVLLAFALEHADRATLIPTLIVSLSLLAAVPNGLDYWFKARTSAAGPALARTGATLVSAAVKGLCLLLGLGVIALAWSIVLEAVLVALGLWCAFRWNLPAAARAHLSFQRSLVGPLLRDSRPYWYSGVAIVLYMKIDVVMLGYLSTHTQTGIYGLAQKLSEVVYVVPVALVGSAFPSLFRQFQASGAADPRSQQMLFDLALGGSFAAVLVGNLLARPVIETLFGPSYEAAVNIFHLHSLSCIAIGMNEARWRWMGALALQRYAPIVTSLGLVINIAMNAVLIPVLGAEGAAITTVVSYFLSGYASSFIFPPLRGLGASQTRALWPWGRLYGAALNWHRGRRFA